MYFIYVSETDINKIPIIPSKATVIMIWASAFSSLFL